MDLNKPNITFFIGAGLTKAVINTAPIGEEFFSKAFIESNDYLEDSRIENVRRFIERVFYKPTRKNIPRIEDVLSILDHSIQQKEALSREYLLPEILKVRQDIEYLIGEVISHELDKQRNQDTKIRKVSEFVQNMVKYIDAKSFHHNQYAYTSTMRIISTNYDLIMDNALMNAAPSSNYGIPIRNPIYWNTNLNLSTAKGMHIKASRDDNNNHRINNGIIPLIKIHGSLNWLYCPKCNEIDIRFGDKVHTVVSGLNGKLYCSNPQCTSEYDSFIVTPTMMKEYNSPFLQRLWKCSEQILSSSSKIVFIGYSLPEADYHLRCLLTRSIIDTKKKIEILVIDKPINKIGDKKQFLDLKKRYKSLFGKRVIAAPIGFSEFVDQWDHFIP